MNKQEFLAELRKGLSGIPQKDTEEWMSFYSEMIDDRMEEGLSESESVNEIGAVKDVVDRVLSEIPLTRLVKERVKPKRALKIWEIALIVLGSPIWFPLLLAAVIVVLAFYIVLWSIIAVFWAADAVLALCPLCGIITMIVILLGGSSAAGIATFGVGIFCAGLSIFLFFGCKAVTKGILILTKKIALLIKSLFVRKEKAK